MVETLTRTEIRKAEIQDKESIIILVREFFEESLSAYNLSLDSETINNTVANFIINHILFVAVEGNRIIGCIGGSLIRSIFDNAQIVAQEAIWYVAKDKRKGSIGIRLINVFETECRRQGADLILMVNMGNLNTDILDRLYKIKNYKLMENQYIKEA